MHRVNSLRCRFVYSSSMPHTLSLSPTTQCCVLWNEVIGFAHVSFVLNIDRLGRGRAITEAMYGIGVFLYGRKLCTNNEIIRQL